MTLSENIEKSRQKLSLPDMFDFEFASLPKLETPFSNSHNICFFKILPNNTDSRNSNPNKASFNLLSCNFQDFPRTFKIKTNNRTYSFNSYLLTCISPIIKNRIGEDPEYHLNIEDPENIMKKVEDLFRMIPVEFTNSEIPTLTKLFGALFLRFPQIDKANLETFQMEFDKSRATDIFRQVPKKVQIIINSETVECNAIAVLSSRIIREAIENDPTRQKFQFQMSETKHFQIISDLFNFRTIRVTFPNIDFLQKLNDLLQIDCIHELLENYNQLYSKKLDLAESLEPIVKPVTDLFDLLYSIDQKGPEQVCLQLMDTEWVHEPNIIELIPCMLNVIHTDLRLHPYFLKLILLLDKRSKELNQFLSLFVSRLFKEIGQSISTSAFLYKLVENNIVPFEEVQKAFLLYQNIDSPQKLSFPERMTYLAILQLIFKPELEERGIKIDPQPKPEKGLLNPPKPEPAPITPFTNDQYKEFRKDFMPLNDIVRLIINDDVDNLHLKISQENININEPVTPISLFIMGSRPDQGTGKFLLTYAAEYGSINCFKYLLLNHSQLPTSLLVSAITGGNLEIVRLAHSTMMNVLSRIQDNPNDFNPQAANAFFSFQSEIYTECLSIAIILHRNSIIEWLFEQIRDTKHIQQSLRILYDACAKACNIQAINIFMNNSFDITEYLDITKYSVGELINIRKDISNSTLNNNNFYGLLIENGFCHFLEYILKVSNQTRIDYKFVKDTLTVIHSDNPSILSFIDNFPVSEILYSAIELNALAIVDYIWSNLSYRNQSIDFYNIYHSCAASNSIEMLKKVTSKYPIEESKQFIKLSQYLKIIGEGCIHSNYDFVKMFTDFLMSITTNLSFTTPFLEALTAKSSRICQFFINKNVNLDLLDIAAKNGVVLLENGKFVPLLYQKANDSIRNQLFYSFLYTYVSSPLSESHKQHFLEFLKLDQSGHLKSLLNEYSQDSPLVYAAYSGNDVAIDVFTEFLGDNISNHIQQIYLGLKQRMVTFYSPGIISFGPLDRIRPQSRISEVHQLIKNILNRFSKDDEKASILFKTFLMSVTKNSDACLIPFCLEHIKDQTIIQELSSNNPFIIAIRELRLDAINAFLEYFGENVDKQHEQIEYAIKLLLRDYSKVNLPPDTINNEIINNFLEVLKRLYQVVNFDDLLFDKDFLISIFAHPYPSLIEFCLEKTITHPIFGELSIDNPFIYSIQIMDSTILSLFLTYFGDNIVEHVEQINYALKLLLAKSYDFCIKRHDGFKIMADDEFINELVEFESDVVSILELLFPIEAVDLDISYFNETFLTLAIKYDLRQIIDLCLPCLSPTESLEELSLNNPLILTIQEQNTEVFDRFVLLCRDELPNLTEQINYGINLLMEFCLSYVGNNEESIACRKPVHLEREFQFLNYILNIEDIELGPQVQKILEFAIHVSNIDLVESCLLKLSDANIFEEISPNNPFVSAIMNLKLDVASLFIPRCGNFITKLVNQIPQEKLDRAFYYCHDELAQVLVLNENLNVNYFHVIPDLIENRWTSLDDPYPFYSMEDKKKLKHQNFSAELKYATSLIHSIETGQFKKSELIINHPHFDPKLSDANEAILMTISKKNAELFTRLLEFVDINSPEMSLLRLCCKNKFQKGVDAILNDPRFDVLKIDFTGLLLTVLKGQIILEIVKSLIDYDSKHTKILDFGKLLPNGKSFFTQIKEPKADSSNSFELKTTVPYLLFLLEKGVDANQPDLFGVYPLQHAIQNKYFHFVLTLLTSGTLDFSVKITAQHVINGTYLHLAAYTSVEIIKELKSLNVFDLDSTDDLGHTPYQVAKIVHPDAYPTSFGALPNSILYYLQSSTETV